jgi:hypothetical protein
MIVHKPSPSRSDDAPRRIAEAEWGTVREAGQPPGRPREAGIAAREAPNGSLAGLGLRNGGTLESR